MTAGVSLPFLANYPAGHAQGGPAGTLGAVPAKGAAVGPAADVVDIRAPLPGGSFTAAAGSRFSLRELYDAGPKAFDTVARYRVALRDDAGSAAGGTGGRLVLDGRDVTAQLDFSPLEFNALQFVAGSEGSRQDLVVVARAGRPGPDGRLTGIVDSPAVEITARVTGTVSIDAIGALRAEVTASGATEVGAADVIRVVQDAGLYDGLGGKVRPALTTAGNFTAQAGDGFSLRDLYDAGPRAFDTVARYRVALRDLDGGDAEGGVADGGRLMLEGRDVTGRVDFSPMEFNSLLFVAGAEGGRQELVVVARAGKPELDGRLSGIVDSPAVAITAAVTGIRSINAMFALRTQDAGMEDAAFVGVVRDAELYGALGGTARPPLRAVGDFTAAAGDAFALRDLYDAGPKAFDAVARYRVALRNEPGATAGGRLVLDGQDVTARTDFSPLEFNSLLFVAGPDGSRQDLVVVARTGRVVSGGGLAGIVDSPAVAVAVGVTGARSINAVPALRPEAGMEAEATNDGAFIKVVQDADLYGVIGGAARPALGTAGNFTAVAGDSFSLRDLYDAGPKAFDTIARYRVALRDEPGTSGGGRLVLDGRDVTGQVDFLPLEFNALQFVAGPGGSRQDIVVVARQGTPDGKGGLARIVDSPAVQITAAVTGERSINAATALRTQDEATGDAGFLALVREAALYDGTGTRARPPLGAVGNFTAAAGDRFSLRELYDAGPKAFDTVARYRVALRDDAGLAAGGTGGRLVLDGRDVTGQLDFSPLEFNALQFVAGAEGSGQDLVVVARAGRLGPDGRLTGIVDSPAVEITARVTGQRSINAAAALRDPDPASADEGFLRLVREAGVYAGLGGTARPVLATRVRPDPPPVPAEVLPRAVGAFQSAGAPAPDGTGLDNLPALYAGMTGGSVSSAAMARNDALRALVLMLADADVGGMRVGGGLPGVQAFALQAYRRTRD